MDDMTCAHCLRPCATTYVCTDCRGPLCVRCATEAGVFGVRVILRRQAADRVKARLQAIEARAEETELRRGHR
jgi:hypothetical protein